MPDLMCQIEAASIPIILVRREENEWPIEDFAPCGKTLNVSYSCLFPNYQNAGSLGGKSQILYNSTAKSPALSAFSSRPFNVFGCDLLRTRERANRNVNVWKINELFERYSDVLRPL